MGLLKLAEKHSPAKLEEACTKAFAYSGKTSYKSISNLLVAMKSESDSFSDETDTAKVEAKPQGIIGGARYYGVKKS